MDVSGRRGQLLTAVLVVSVVATSVLYFSRTTATASSVVTSPFPSAPVSTCAPCGAVAECDAAADKWRPPLTTDGLFNGTGLPLMCAQPLAQTPPYDSGNACYSDMELFPQPVGPHNHTTRGKSLMVMATSTRTKDILAATVNHFGFGNFSWIFFAYDADTVKYLMEQPWAPQVVVIFAKSQMKWWYIKRFVPPEVAIAYDFVWVWDDDAANLSELGFDPIAFQNVMLSHGLSVAQPAIRMTKPIADRVTMYVEGDHIGRFSRFVEIQFPVFNFVAYNCFWQLLPRDSSSGFGLDVYLHEMCGWTGNFAVIDKYSVFHGDIQTTGYNTKAAMDELWLLDKKLEEFLGRKPVAIYHTDDTFLPVRKF